MNMTIKIIHQILSTLSDSLFGCITKGRRLLIRPLHCVPIADIRIARRRRHLFSRTSSAEPSLARSDIVTPHFSSGEPEMILFRHECSPRGRRVRLENMDGRVEDEEGGGGERTVEMENRR